MDKNKLNNPMASLMKHFTISLVWAIIGMITGFLFLSDTVIEFINLLFLILIVLTSIIFIFSSKHKKSNSDIQRTTPMKWAYILTFLDGILTYPIILYYLGSVGTLTVLSVLFTTILIFAVLTKKAYNQEDYKYLSLSNILFVTLLAVFIFSFINLFIGSSFVELILSIIGVVLFSAYILYDISHFKLAVDSGLITEKDHLTWYVIDLYLDFINIFLDLLRLIARLRD